MAKVLTASNSHLKSPASRRAAVFRTVATSSAIEGIQVAKKATKAPGAIRTRGSKKPPTKNK
ncbi:MAG: hypothetical protein ACRD2Z_10465 [Thermoanaerobaculia bacterium]